MNINKSFIEHCKKKKFEINQNQLVIIDNLSNFYKENFQRSYFEKFNKIFKKKNNKAGFYLVGDVGVGKTMILNFFFDQL